MADGYLVVLGDGSLDSGDQVIASSGGPYTFTIDTTIGTGSWTWTGTQGSFTANNTTEPGTYNLGTDGNVYFVPDFGTFNLNLTSGTVESAPSFSTNDGIVSGTDGDDIIDSSYTDPDGDQVDAGDGTGAAGNEDQIRAGAGDDTISAGAEDDTVHGGSGSDSIGGGSGNDTIYGDSDPDEIVTPISINQTNYSDTANGYTITAQNIVGGVLSAPSVDNVAVYSGGGFGASGSISDSDSGVQEQIGYDLDSGQSETLSVNFDEPVTEASFSFGVLRTQGFGEVGHWTIYNDGVLVAEGDFTEATPGSGSGTVNLSGYGEFDEIVFTALPQTDGTDGSDYVITDITFQPHAPTGNDTISGGTGNDTIYGEDGDDIVTGGQGTDVIYGGEGNDILLAGGESGDQYGEDSIYGGSGNDTITGENGNQSLYGGDGNDIIYGGYDWITAETDVIDGGDGDDILISGMNVTPQSGTVIYGDIIIGGAGNDSILGGMANDTLIGGTGADTMDGGAGSDTFTVAQGDVATGGDGDDVFNITDLGEAGAGTINIAGGEGDETAGDTLDFNGQLQLGSINYTNTDDDAGGLSGTATLLDGTVVTFTEIETIICFTAGSGILTANGVRSVETLSVGDQVVTRDNGLQKIRWIGKKTVAATGAMAPIRIAAGTMGNTADLLVSPQHRMLCSGWEVQKHFGECEVLTAAKYLINGSTVRTEECPYVTYVHILFDQHEVIYAEGAATESFFPGDAGLDAVDASARDELFSIFPELRSSNGQYQSTARPCLKKYESAFLSAA